MVFPEDFPPEGLDNFTKLLIYFAILYVLTTALSAWLVTRRRKRVASGPSRAISSGADPLPANITEALSFDDSRDVLSGLKVQIEGAEASLNKLKSISDQSEISSLAFNELSRHYRNQVTNLTEQMNEILHANIESSTGEVIEGITDEDIVGLEADLEQQLMDLENDESFLRHRPRRNLNQAMTGETKTTPPPQTKSPTPSPPVKKAAIPPPPMSTKSQSTPSPTANLPTPTASKSVSPPTPAASQKKTVIPPPPSKGTTMPPAPSKGMAMPPKPSGSMAPPSPQPSAVQPSIAGDQSMAGTDEEGMFAKSTSIAALRMDMLRELARLKKLINEDQDQ